MTFFLFTRNNADNNIAFGGGGDIGDLKTRVTALETKTEPITSDEIADTTTITSKLEVDDNVSLAKNLQITGTLNGINIAQIITQGTPAWTLLSRLAENLSSVTVSPDVVTFDGTVAAITMGVGTSISTPQLVLNHSGGAGTLTFDGTDLLVKGNQSRPRFQTIFLAQI
jgi:hypothetical protein